MTNEEIEGLHERAKKVVKVSCDEYHQHSAREDCLDGDSMAVVVCILCEELKDTRNQLKQLCINVGVKL